MRYEIVVEHDPSAGQSGGKEWNASLFPIREDGKSGDLIAVGAGVDPRAAVRMLLVEGPSEWGGEQP